MSFQLRSSKLPRTGQGVARGKRPWGGPKALPYGHDIEGMIPFPAQRPNPRGRREQPHRLQTCMGTAGPLPALGGVRTGIPGAVGPHADRRFRRHPPGGEHGAERLHGRPGPGQLLLRTLDRRRAEAPSRVRLPRGRGRPLRLPVPPPAGGDRMAGRGRVDGAQPVGLRRGPLRPRLRAAADPDRGHGGDAAGDLEVLGAALPAASAAASACFTPPTPSGPSPESPASPSS